MKSNASKASAVTLEKIKELPTSFQNKIIESLCQSDDFKVEISKFESSKIKLRNKAIDIIEVLNQKEINVS